MHGANTKIEKLQFNQDFFFKEKNIRYTTTEKNSEVC